MLSDTERQNIDRELSHYADPRAGCVEAMKIVQRERGWLSDAALADISERLGMSREELDSIATFYNLLFRKPVGRHVVLMCDSASCWILGYEKLLEHLRSRYGVGFGDTTADNRFTLLPSQCLGACDGGPAMVVDDDLHRDLTPERIDGILERYR